MGDKPQPREKPRKTPAWKKALLVLSIILMLAGLAVRGYGYVTGVEDPAATAQADPAAPRPSGMERGFVSRQDSPTESPAPAADTETALVHTWSPLVFQLGFGFFAGFCIAYVLHAFMKITLITVGIFLLALFGLHFGGVLDVDWSGFAGKYETVANWLGVHFATFGEFVASHLPSAATSVAGLLVGFRKG